MKIKKLIINFYYNIFKIYIINDFIKLFHLKKEYINEI